MKNSPPVPLDGELLDNRAGHKWLPEEEDLEAIVPEVDDFLRTLDGRMRLVHCKYDGARLTNLSSFRPNGLMINEQEWQSSVNINQVMEDTAALDMYIQFTLIKGTAEDAGVAVVFDFENWDPENYVMLPASVYNGNRCKIVDRRYAAGLDRKYLYHKNIPLMSVPIPQLSPVGEVVSRLEVNSCNLATPAMCFLSHEKGHGFILLTEQNTPFADNGFIIEESTDRRNASIVINAPGVREKKPLFVGFTESQDRGQISLRVIRSVCVQADIRMNA